MRRPVVGIIGSRECSAETGATARRLGSELAAQGAVLMAGGRGPLQENALAGYRAGGGTLAIGICPPGPEPRHGPDYDVVIAAPSEPECGLLQSASAQAVIAFPGGLGTLFEISLAAKAGRPVALLGLWPPLPGFAEDSILLRTRDPVEAITAVLDALSPPSP